MTESTETAVYPTAGTDAAEAEGATVADATEAALRQLGASADEALVEVLAQPAAAIPGENISAGAARVRASRIEAFAVEGKRQLEELLAKMGIEAGVSIRRAAGSRRPDAPVPPYVLDIHGDDLGLLIGWRGETLRAIQTVLNLMLDEGRDVEGAENRRLIVDIERYRARREDQVREMAIRLAARVKRSGERYTLDPMHAYERRVVHIALEDDPGVRTESSGKEPTRRVIINPTGPPQEAPRGPRRSGWRDRY